MKIIMMNGGLGNQLFQYIFYRIVEERYKDQDVCFIDDSAFFLSDQHNGYELEKIFGLKPNLLSEFFDQETWSYILAEVGKGRNIVNVLQDSGTEMTFVSEIKGVNQHNYLGDGVLTPVNEYNPSILERQGNVYYYGYWINRDWYKSVESIIKQALTFPGVQDKKNHTLLRLILNTESVAVHIRRGDFLDIGWALSESYYKGAVKKVNEKAEHPLYFIFSDDISWCMENYKELGFNLTRDNVIFVDGNSDGMNYIDMQLMANCRHMIIANSSFSYLAALINDRRVIGILPPGGRQL